MKNLLPFLSLAVGIIFFTACQKELHYDAVTITYPGTGQAIGTLKSSSGNCLPSTVNGVFTKDSLLKTSNFMQVTADITGIGTYVIKSDTLDGFYFTGTGSFTSTGNNLVNLSGHGTPTSTGVKTFSITFGSSICKIEVTVVATAPLPTAYTFTCAGTTFGTGIYTTGTMVGALHTVTLIVNVANPGPWSITTATVNGISFSGSGTFTGIGNASVTLTASGTPVAASPPAYNYTVTASSSSCMFSITVVSPAPPANLDYVPQTDFSNWSAKLVGGTPADTTFVQVSTSSKTFGANTYKIFEVKNMGTPTDSVFNRKTGSLYYQYIDGNLGVLTNPINAEYLVLDSSKAVNGTWVSHLGPNVAMGFPISDLRIDAKILGKGETQTVQGIVYNNVIRVKYTYTATVIGLGDVPVAEEERWFARGLGVIRSSVVNLVNPGTTVNETTRTQVF